MCSQTQNTYPSGPICDKTAQCVPTDAIEGSINACRPVDASAPVGLYGPEACDDCPLYREISILKSDKAYWRAMHAKAVEREERLKQEKAELEAKLKLREKQLFGRKSEQGSGKSESQKAEGEGEKKTQGPATRQPRPRSQGLFQFGRGNRGFALAGKRTDLSDLRTAFRRIRGYRRFRDSRNRGQSLQKNSQAQKICSGVRLRLPSGHCVRASGPESSAQRNFRRFHLGSRAVGQISLHEADESISGRLAHPRSGLGARYVDRRTESHRSVVRPRLRSDSGQEPRRRTMARG